MNVDAWQGHCYGHGSAHTVAIWGILVFSSEKKKTMSFEGQKWSSNVYMHDWKQTLNLYHLNKYLNPNFYFQFFVL